MVIFYSPLLVNVFINFIALLGDIVKLNDEKLPAGWEKRAKYKTCGTKAGKWDVDIIG